MPTRTFEIFCEWDDEAKVWFVSHSNVPGLSAEAPNQDAMRELLLRRVPELVALNLPDCKEAASQNRVPLELLIQSKEKLRIGC